MITGQQLREARKRAGYKSQKALAAALKVSERTVWDWEQNGVASGEDWKVRELLWPAPAPLSAYDDVALLSELGRRLSLAHRQSDQTDTSGASELPEATPTVTPAADEPRNRGVTVGRSGGPRRKTQ